MINRRVRTVLLCGLVSTLAACTAPDPAQPDATTSAGQGEPAAPTEPEPGAAGIGDRYYPRDGNGGYDVSHYEVGVGYDPGSGVLDGDTLIKARATKPLSRFNLDLRGLEVESVEVNGRRAKFSRQHDFELVITPAQVIPEGGGMRVRVRYGGSPSASADNQLGGNGWQRTQTGGAFVLGEPHSAAFWYPVNDHPRDKATFTLTARVPDGWETMSIGRREQQRSADGWTTTKWVESSPVASYLTTIAIDRFTIERDGTAAGGRAPVLNAFAPGSEHIREDAARTREIIDFLAGKFGPYPFRSAGGIYLGDSIGYSLETQGRPTYTRGADLGTIVHEFAHQWFGNAVSVRSWSDICLNECLASYSQWLWAEAKEGDDLDARYRDAVAAYRDDAEFWGDKLYDMGPGNEFSGVYSKGLLAMHALRALIGDEAFNRVLKEWPAAHRDGNASWPQFEKFVIATADTDEPRLRAFFDAWFRGTERPADEHLYPGRLSA